GPMPRAGRDDASRRHADQSFAAGAVPPRRLLARDGGPRAESAGGPGPRARERQNDRRVQRAPRAAEDPPPAASAGLRKADERGHSLFLMTRERASSSQAGLRTLRTHVDRGHPPRLADLAPFRYLNARCALMRS